MMHDPKPIASLSAGLLARKGSARPAMRRQVALSGLNQGFGAPGFGGHDDLGWNDMGYDVDPHHTLAEDTRPGAHGLSPMHGSERDPEVQNALNDAVDRAIDGDAGAPAFSVDPIVPHAPVPTEAEPPMVRRQIERIVQEIAPAAAPPTPEPVAAATPHEEPAMNAAVVSLPVVPQVRPRARAGTKGSFAFTLRLDPERHLRLRLASASSNRSAQAILIDLVDAYLAAQPELDAFAAGLPATHAGRKAR